MASTMAEPKKLSGMERLFATIFVIAGLIAAHNYLWGEQEGEAKYEDCRNKIMVKQDSTEKLFKKFTCSYAKNENGKIISGVCVHVETEGAVCQTAYIYYKQP
jgi:hypothetical protein